MTGFELRICGVGNKHSNNCATISVTKKKSKIRQGFGESSNVYKSPQK